VVVEERLRQRRKGAGAGRPFSFLYLHYGQGPAWKGDAAASEYQEDLLDKKTPTREETPDVEWVSLVSNQHLGIATLGALKEHERIARFRQFLQGWHLSYFDPSAARARPKAGAQKHLNVRGDNLSNVVQYMEREHGDRFAKVLTKIAHKIQGINKIDTTKTEDGFLLLRFYANGFDKPFFVQQMSDGTLKVFTYLLLLEDPEPAPFICIEEPESGLYHKLLPELAHEFREHATGRKNAPQLFITTHQPIFVDALHPNETWILEKGLDGYSTIRRTSDDPLIQNMVSEGVSLGSLWYSDYFDAR
jgi:predicted ATPase